jgi:hypothetical protein
VNIHQVRWFIRGLSNPEGINQYTSGGHHGARGEASSISKQRFKSEHGTAVVSTAPHGAHSGSIRVRLKHNVPGGDGMEMQYHSKDPKEALAIAKAFVDKGQAGLNEHFAKKYPTANTPPSPPPDLSPNPISHLSFHDDPKKADEAHASAHDKLVASGYTKGETTTSKQYPESTWTSAQTAYTKGGKSAILSHSTSASTGQHQVAAYPIRKKSKQY